MICQREVSSRRVSKAGIGFRPVVIFQKSAPSVWSHMVGLRRSPGLLLRSLAAGPSPAPESPWQERQFLAYRVFPAARALASAGTGLAFREARPGAFQGSSSAA